MLQIREMLDLAIQQHQAGYLQQAEGLYRQVLQADPRHVDALHFLGLLVHQCGRVELAIAYISQALVLKPDDADAHNNLGNILQEQRMLDEAAASYRKALRFRPDFAAAFNNLGAVLQDQGKLDEAAAHLKQALVLNPDYADPHTNLGNIFQALGKPDEAAASYRRAGNALKAHGHLDQAVASYHQALRLNANCAEAHTDLGGALMLQGNLDEAIASYRQALRLKPNLVAAHSNLIFLMSYHPAFDAAAIHEECRRWNQHLVEPLKEYFQPHCNHPDPERRLRIGYVSPDFRDHVDSLFTVPLFSNHDHRQFEIYLYASVARPDAMTERLRGYADVWRDTLGLSVQHVADMVRSDQIDILVDLEMHAGDQHLLFGRKPAPVQVAWLGHPGTTGLSTIDYRLTDPYLDPPGLFDAFYSEESVRLPDTFWCYDPLTEQPPVNALPALNNGHVTFGCLNNFCKVNDSCLALWGQVLRAVPGSRLLLLAPRGQAREHVLCRLEQAGVAAAEVVEFADRMPRPEYLKLYHRIDVGLDPLPYNGHTTSLDAFWMGVPTLTMLGWTSVGRAGWSQLCNLDLRDLAAHSLEQYVAIAKQLACDLPRLQKLRATLRQRMRQSPLMDGKRFARHMEQAFRHMWRRWCRRVPQGPG